MKYLVHFRPDQELSDLIQLQNNSTFDPKIGFHCTIVSLYVDETLEKKYLSEIRKVSFHPFEVVTERYVVRNDNKVILTLSEPHELVKLHHDLMRASKPFALAPKDFEDKSKRYCFDNYKPHIVVSTQGNKFEMGSDPLGKKISVKKLTISKEAPDGWKDHHPDGWKDVIL
jgi:hypothetical protein